MLHVGLDGRLVELPANQSFGVEDGVGGVHGHLVLGGISDETLLIREGNLQGKKIYSKWRSEFSTLLSLVLFWQQTNTCIVNYFYSKVKRVYIEILKT